MTKKQLNAAIAAVNKGCQITGFFFDPTNPTKMCGVGCLVCPTQRTKVLKGDNKDPEFDLGDEVIAKIHKCYGDDINMSLLFDITNANDNTPGIEARRKAVIKVLKKHYNRHHKSKVK